ncbi:MAG: hypothetical protein P4L92_18995 [Rudaea sp.]|nr:hypothetical protein [Rudaea sp.]
MYKCIVVTLSTAVFALLAATAFATGFSSLEERMSQAEFHAAGLDKLSPDELKSLDDWLRTHNTVVTTVVTTTPSGEPVFYPRDSDRQLVESRIDGPFNGWRGHTVFKLENGEEWTQQESGAMVCGSVDHPKVKIKPMLLGSWLMYVESCGDSLRVTRTK